MSEPTFVASRDGLCGFVLVVEDAGSLPPTLASADVMTITKWSISIKTKLGGGGSSTLVL
jgi:hypothetical protein